MTLRVADYVDDVLGNFGLNGAPAFVGLCYNGDMPHFSFVDVLARNETLNTIEDMEEPEIIVILGRSSFGGRLLIMHFVIWNDANPVPVGLLSFQDPNAIKLLVGAQEIFKAYCAVHLPPSEPKTLTPSVN